MKKLVISCMCVCLIFSACEKEANEVSNQQAALAGQSEILIPSTAKLIDTKNSRSQYASGFEDYEEFAQELAKMLNDKNFRKFLKSEASKQFDGDFDILVSSHSEKCKKFEKLTNQIPQLNIGFNELIQKWDTDKYSILVATRIGLNQNSKALFAFDSKGKKYEIDGIQDPDKPIMVIGYNERVELINGKIKKINFSKSESTSSANLKIAACTFPYRTGAANYERLKGLKFNNLPTYEQWYDFKPEIRFRMYTPVSSSNFSTITNIVENFYNPTRGSVDNTWWTFNAPLFIWNTPNYSTTMLYEFTEIDDYGQSSTVTIGLSGTYGVGSNNSAGTPNITQSITPSVGYSFTKKGADMVIGRAPYSMLDCPPNSDDSYSFNSGTSGFFFKSGY